MKNIIIGNNMSELGEFLKRKDFFTFSFVRHPFERYKLQATTKNKYVCYHEINFIRLVSAFVDKILHKGYRRLASKLHKSFVMFVDYVLKVSQQEKCFDKLKTGCQTNVHW